MGYWLKLYTDILDDPKYFKLSKEARLGMYELLLVAKKIENGELTGQLPCIEDIAFYTRRPVEEWQKVIPELVSIGLITDQENPVITNYIKRQDAIDPETRMKQYRKKRNDAVMDSETEMQRECNENATKRNGETEAEADKKRIETDIEADAENNDTGGIESNNLVQFFIEKSGIPLGTGGIKKWQSALNKLQISEICEDDIDTAIDEMRSKKLTIATLGSIVTPAIMAKANRITKVPEHRKYLNGAYGEFGSH